MRFSNKLKIVMIILLTYIAIILTTIAAKAQGGPPSGWPPNGGGNGNTPPPNAPCPPVCNTGMAVPIGDWKWQLGLIVLGITSVYYIHKNKNYDTQKN
jgi:hypothetical protein